MASLDADRALRVQQQLRYSTPFWAGGCSRDGDGRWQLPAPGAFQGCAKIINKRAQLVPIVPNPWQLEFDGLMEAQRAAGKPMRGIVLKARKLGFCGAPETRVLTADMRWLTLDEIQPGQQIVAVDEHTPGGKGRSRKLREGVVLAKREVHEPAYRIVFDDGREVTATAPHRWLCREQNGCAEWRTVADMRPGDEVRHVTTPWAPGDIGDGWMGGFIDGEGCLAKKAAGGGELAISQRPSPALDRARDYLRVKGYTFREEVDSRHARTNGRHKDNAKLLVSRMNELFRLIGQSGSTRFTNDTSWWRDRDLPGKRSGVAWAKVVAIEPLGVRRMIDLQTDRKTFIAEGFVSHNSTWVALKFIQRVTQLEYQRAIIVAQDVKTAGLIFDMALLCHTHLPDVNDLGLGFSIRPHILKRAYTETGRKYVVFGEASRRLRENGRTGQSMLEIDTANAPEAGRGYTPQLLHLSEVARWSGQAAQRKMLALLNAVPYEPETIVILESTANGLNHFYRRWVSARDGSRDPDTGETYFALFVPWWRDPEAALPFDTEVDRARFVGTIGDTARFGELVDDEQMLIEAYGCSAEQLAWRRMMIRTQHENSVELFNQENPHSDESAFIGSGHTVFSGILVTRAVKSAEEADPPVRGTLIPDEHVERRTRSGSVMVPQAAVWVPEEKMAVDSHELVVWEHPRRADSEWPDEVPKEERVDGAYVVAVDVAGGEGQTFTAGDFHCVQVFDHRTRQQVAVHESRMGIEHLPLWVLSVALYYNRAQLAVEVNGPGYAVVTPLARTYRYGRMYRRKRFDRMRELTEDLVGWSTDRVTKPVMEQIFASALAEGTAGIRDVGTARQMTTYVVDERGRHGAQDGEHDDRLVTAMIAHAVMDQIRPPRAGKRGRQTFAPRDPLTGY